MINSPALWHCLVRILVNLNIWIVTFELVGIHQNGLVSDILLALKEGLWIFIPDVILKLFVIFGANTVPELWSAVMIVVDTG